MVTVVDSVGRLTLSDTEVLASFFVERVDDFLALGFALEWRRGDLLLALLQSSTGRRGLRRRGLLGCRRTTGSR